MDVGLRKAPYVYRYYPLSVFLEKTILFRGVATGGYIGIYTPQKNQST